MESKFHELKNRLLKNIDQTSESRLYMDIQLAQNCETLMSIIKKDIGYLAKEGILSPGIAEDFKDVFLSAGIKCNSGGSSGYMLIWDGTAVDISGTATAVIWKSERAFIKGRACAFLLGEVSAITCEPFDGHCGRKLHYPCRGRFRCWSFRLSCLCKGVRLCYCRKYELSQH